VPTSVRDKKLSLRLLQLIDKDEKSEQNVKQATDKLLDNICSEDKLREEMVTGQVT